MSLGHHHSSGVNSREGPSAPPREASRAIQERAVGVEGREDHSIAGLHKPGEGRFARRGRYRVRKCRREPARVKGNIALMRPTVMHVGRRQLVAEMRDSVAGQHAVEERAGRGVDRVVLPLPAFMPDIEKNLETFSREVIERVD